MTLKAKEMTGYVRLTQLVEECNFKGANIVKMQETRLTQKVLQNQHYWILAHPCNKGQGGILLGLHKSKALCWIGDQSVLVKNTTGPLTAIHSYEIGNGRTRSVDRCLPMFHRICDIFPSTGR